VFIQILRYFPLLLHGWNSLYIYIGKDIYDSQFRDTGILCRWRKYKRRKKEKTKSLAGWLLINGGHLMLERYKKSLVKYLHLSNLIV